jgi:hypothetical protein
MRNTVRGELRPTVESLDETGPFGKLRTDLSNHGFHAAALRRAQGERSSYKTGFLGRWVARLVVCRRGLQDFDLVLDEREHLPDPLQVGVNIAFALLVEDPLSIHEDFHDALAARGDCYSGVRAEVAEKLVRHPRGGSEVLSTYAVSNLDLDFAFHLRSS